MTPQDERELRAIVDEISPPPARKPGVVIGIPLEGDIRICYWGTGDDSRVKASVRDWIESHPELVELVNHANSLRRAA